MDFTNNDLKSSDLKGAAQHRFTQAQSDANTLRANGLGMLVHCVQAHIDSLALEQKRLAAKYGADSKQARAAVRTLMIAQDHQPLMQAEYIRTKLIAPKPNPDAAVLYGRILDAKNAGVAGASVVLTIAHAQEPSPEGAAVDRGEQQTRKYESETNADGEFTFTLPPQNAAVTLMLEIVDAKGGKTEVEDSVELGSGTVTYREYSVQPSHG
jgi:hypothetical protein